MHHPPLKPGEMFCGNRSDGRIPDDVSHLLTIRLETPAYDIEGKKLPPPYAALVIGAADDAEYDRIRMAKFRKILRGR